MAGVGDWVDSLGDDVASVVESEFQDPAILERFGGADEEEDEGDDNDVEGFEALQKAGVMMQRLVSSELGRRYVRGRAHRDLPVTKPQPRVQRTVCLEEMVALLSIDDDEFYARLSRERVVARVQGATGIGKTRKLCGKIATRCGSRVLQVELDANMAREAREAQVDEYGVSSSSVRWPRERQSFLSVITYEDFCGHVWSRTRDAFFSSFEVMVLDEAHVPHWDVQSAIQFFANFAPATCSLLVLSATVDRQDGPRVAGTVGVVTKLEPAVGWRDMFESGLFEDTMLRDRLMVLLPSDEAVGYARNKCLEMGVEVFALDTASIYREIGEAHRFLSGASSPVPRVLVAHADFGTSYNFRVVKVISAGTVVVQEVSPDGNSMIEKEVCLYESEVVQHMGRVGRGIATSSGGVVLTSEVSPAKQLRASEVAAYYVSLIAGDVKPRFRGMDTVEKWFPKGLSRDTARLLMAICGRYKLPVYLAARYLAPDGKIARRFHKALRTFAQPDAEMPLSSHIDPVGYDQWVIDRVGGYFGGELSNEELLVPFKPTPALRYVMHAISAIAGGFIVVPEWRAPVDGEELSGPEDDAPKTRKKKLASQGMYRYVKDGEPSSVGSDTTVKSGWAYDVDVDKQALRRKREGMSWLATPRGESAAEALRRRFLQAGENEDNGIAHMVPEVRACDLGDTVKVVADASLGAGDSVTAHTPGGTEVIEIRSDTYRAMACGNVLKADSYVTLLKVLDKSKLVDAFVRSTVFDGWNPVWTSLWITAASVPVAQETIRAGVHSTALVLTRRMYERFREEALLFFQTSNLHKKKLKSLLKQTVSINKLARYIREGRAPIAQSDYFVDRWLRMLDLYNKVLDSFEKAGLYDPLSVTATQSALPIDVDASKKRGYVPNPLK